MKFDTRINMYNALVMRPYFNHCSTVWGIIGKIQSDKNQKLQNRAANVSNYETPQVFCWMNFAGKVRKTKYLNN